MREAVGGALAPHDKVEALALMRVRRGVRVRFRVKVGVRVGVGVGVGVSEAFA